MFDIFFYTNDEKLNIKTFKLLKIKLCPKLEYTSYIDLDHEFGWKKHAASKDAWKYYFGTGKFDFKDKSYEIFIPASDPYFMMLYERKYEKRIKKIWTIKSMDPFQYEVHIGTYKQDHVISKININTRKRTIFKLNIIFDPFRLFEDEIDDGQIMAILLNNCDNLCIRFYYAFLYRLIGLKIEPNFINKLFCK